MGESSYKKPKQLKNIVMNFNEIIRQNLGRFPELIPVDDVAKTGSRQHTHGRLLKV